ncbi:Transcription termination protein NusB [Olavius algarvensis spirochete endosymbiont]|uniref:transcription antitermination factor NusB n=1 Tax=Olavius algarvensis spirochete endosymbiont TaxID=260710 RepID=UPI000F23666A|nr:transcription antitermination factor NusB [Olavius algarvensis spirochete endosymbiont]VDB00523.1 Transcription termination protein NusB [Olavius algarvensis spirochete endosymbiont]
MGSRRQARICAFQSLYAWEESKPPFNELLNFAWLETEPGEATREFASLLVIGTVENIESIDKRIKKHLEKWSFERLSKVDLANLRTSVYALIFLQDIPPSVTIDEAVEIAKAFGSDESYRFINGVLDGINKAPLS